MKIFDLKTPLYDVSDAYISKSVYMKYEGGLPFSNTFKDRSAYSSILYAKKIGFKYILAGTCSNMGAAVSSVANSAKLHSCVVYSDSTPSATKCLIQSSASEYYCLPGGFDEVNHFVNEIADIHSNIGCINGNLSNPFSDGYFNIVDELLNQIPDSGKYYLLIPTADGTLLKSLALRLAELKDSFLLKNIDLILCPVQHKDCSPVIKAIENHIDPENISHDELFNHYISDRESPIVQLSVKNPWPDALSVISALNNVACIPIVIDNEELKCGRTNIDGIPTDWVGRLLDAAAQKFLRYMNHNIIILFTGNFYTCPSTRPVKRKQKISNCSLSKDIIKDNISRSINTVAGT